MDRAQDYYAQDPEWAGQVLFSPAQAFLRVSSGLFKAF